MDTELTTLIDLNVRIGEAESDGNAEFLDGVLAPRLAFRRVDGSFADRDSFLEAVKPSARRTTEITSVSMLGRHRALVTCVVSMKVGDKTRSFDNVRIFVRSTSGGWMLLGWANEPADATADERDFMSRPKPSFG